MAHICMLVTSELDRDPRVQKEARIAYEAGHQVTVLCRSYDGPSMPYVVKPLGIGRRISPLSKYVERLRTNIRLLRLTISCKPNIIHANDLDTLPAAYFAAKLCRAALIYDAHELWADAGRDVGSVGRKMALLVEKFISRRADAVVAVSSFRAERMAVLLDIPMPTVVMNTPPYVAYEQLKPMNWVKQFTGKKIVLHQGRYVAGRGIEEAVLAVKYLPDDVVFVFRGYGPIEDDLRAVVQQHRLQSRVVFLPPVPMNDLLQNAVGADLGLVLYMPVNENNLYAAPNKMFEYMMAGVPSVSSDIPYTRQILLDYGVGDVFEPGNVRQMAQVIERLLSDPARLAEMKKRCIHHAHQFSWDVEGQKLLREYESIFNEQD